MHIGHNKGVKVPLNCSISVVKVFLALETGHGGFGHVVLCKNKLDGRQYAVKKIRLKDKSMPDRILR